VYEGLRPALSDYQSSQFRKVIAGLEQKASEAASAHVLQKEQEALAIRDDALRQLTEARDEYEAIAREAAEGRTEASVLSKRLNRAQRQQAASEEALAKAEEAAAEIERVESDPVAWYADLQERIPSMKADLPW